jgi:ribose transport system substrate-binding protein
MTSPAFRIAAITKNKTNPAYTGARIGAARVAAAHGGIVESFVPDIPDDVDQQRALIAAAIDSAPDAFVIVPAHETALTPTIQRIRDKGLPLAFAVVEAEGIDADCFVNSDDYDLAFAIAEHLIAAMDGAGDVVIVEGHPASPTSEPRTRGFRDAVAAHPSLRIVEQVRGDYQFAIAQDAMTQVLARAGNIDGVLVANDYMAMGVLDALDTAGRAAKVVGINAMPDAIGAVRDGRLLATSAFDAMKMACLATEAVIRVLQGKPVPRRIELPVEIVDASNFTAWDLPYEDRPLPVWNDVAG